MTTLYAQPYSPELSGFNFDSLEAFEPGLKRLKARCCEEVEIQYIDGDQQETRLANAVRLNQNEVHLWFEELADLNEHNAEKLIFLLDCGYIA